jgi:hypothetical protein
MTQGMEQSTRVEHAKFDVGGGPPAIDAGELPWAYGEDRITALVRDPESAYVYWEITDEGIAAARSRLGPAGQHGWCNLRVYDTTGRDFDGTNAHDYFDIRVDRNDREYFVMIRRPASSMHVEVGIRTHEGYFQAIARSGRADFPRNSPSPDSRLEWMSVTSSDRPPCVAPYRSRYAGPEPRLPGREGAGYFDVWRAGYAPSMPEPAHDGHRVHGGTTSTTHTRTFEHRSRHIERWWHLDEWRAEWRAGLRFFRWEHYDPQRVIVELLGETPSHLAIEGGEMMAYGPWRLTIRDLDDQPGRRTLATWSIRWIRATTPVIERWEGMLEREAVWEYERETHESLGGSEQRRLLERGASEIWRLGGSERMWMGASEWRAAGGSEVAWQGASEALFLGASGRIGASEWLGSSATLGASERHASAGQSLAHATNDRNERWADRTGGR